MIGNRRRWRRSRRRSGSPRLRRRTARGRPRCAAASARSRAEPTPNRAAASSRTGDHRPDREGADGDQGRAADVLDFAARALPGLHADQQSPRRVAPDRERRGTRAIARRRQRGATQAGRLYRSHRVRGRKPPRDSARHRVSDQAWNSILKERVERPASMLYSDLDVALRTVRDMFSSEVERLWCDDPNTYSRIVQFIQTYMPRLRARASCIRGRSRYSTGSISSRKSSARSTARYGSSRAATWCSIRPKR